MTSNWDCYQTDHVQGTVTPSHYIVVDDDTGLGVDVMQKIRYLAYLLPTFSVRDEDPDPAKVII